MERIRILVVDDHPTFRVGIRTVLTGDSSLELIGEAESGEQAIEMAKESQPDVILMDLRLPGINGFEAMRQILAESPHIAILVITMLDDSSIFTAMKAGARGYLLKESDPQVILNAIHTISNGNVIISPQNATRMKNYFEKSRSSSSNHIFPDLTDREYDVLTLMAQGLTNDAIAERLIITEKTVRTHNVNIYSKLQVRDRAEAIMRARDAGLYDSPLKDQRIR